MFSLVSVLFFQVVDPSIAKVILTDSRLTSFTEVMNEEYGSGCFLPAHNDLVADVRCNGTGDMASCYYTFNVRCEDRIGLSNLKVVAEFFPLGNFVLNLDVTANFRK